MRKSSTRASSKLETSVLTLEGVGCYLCGEKTGGLTSDQDHQKAIVLTFTEAGTYTIKASYSDEAADNTSQ